jgi:hypothetical protein
LFYYWPEEASSGTVCPHHIFLRDVFCKLLVRERKVGSIPMTTCADVMCLFGRYYRRARILRIM